MEMTQKDAALASVALRCTANTKARGEALIEATE